MILYKGADSEAQGPRRFWRVWTVMTPNPSQGARDTMNLLGMPVETSNVQYTIHIRLSAPGLPATVKIRHGVDNNNWLRFK